MMLETFGDEYAPYLARTQLFVLCCAETAPSHARTYRLGRRALSVPTSAMRPSASVPRQLR